MRHKIKYKGKTYTLRQVCNATGLSYDCVEHRFNYNWTPEEIFETPVQTKFRRKKKEKVRVIDLRGKR